MRRSFAVGLDAIDTGPPETMPTYQSMPKFEHGLPESTGVLVVNLGTPDAPSSSAVRRFLRQFLWDPRVVEYPRPLWWLIPEHGLKSMIDGRRLQEVARELLSIAADGLASRARLNASGDDETGFLEPLQKIAESGVTPAEYKLDLYQNRWGRSVDPIFEECAY